METIGIPEHPTLSIQASVYYISRSDLLGGIPNFLPPMYTQGM